MSRQTNVTPSYLICSVRRETNEPQSKPWRGPKKTTQVCQGSLLVSFYRQKLAE